MNTSLLLRSQLHLLSHKHKQAERRFLSETHHQHSVTHTMSERVEHLLQIYHIKLKLKPLLQVQIYTLGYMDFLKTALIDFSKGTVCNSRRLFLSLFPHTSVHTSRETHKDEHTQEMESEAFHG